MSYIQGADRAQTMLLPSTVEDYVSSENPVRAIDAFVETLDLVSLGFTMAGENTKGGRPRYSPGTLLKLYLWGYFARIRSSRRLEEACTSNLNAIWITGNLAPDHSTISDFRKTNAKALKSIFRQFNLICIDLQLFSRELVAIDGTFIKAVNSKSRSFTKNKLEKLLKTIDEKVEDYLERLDTIESQSQPKADGEGLQRKIEQLKAKTQRYKELLKDCEQRPSGQVSLTDPDSRQLMKRGSHTVGYNLQSAVDEKHNLIATCEVTTEPTDHHLLHKISQQTKQDLSLEPNSALKVLADTGYHDSSELGSCQADNTTTYVPGQKTKSSGDGCIREEDFIHHPESDTYQCPQGKHLPRKADELRERGKGYRVYYQPSLCKGCPLLKSCTNGKYRKIKINFHHEALRKNSQRLKDNPTLYRKRAAMVEHPFGTIKDWNGRRDLLCRGLELASAETRLSGFAYNFKRVLKLIGMDGLMTELRGRQSSLGS